MSGYADAVLDANGVTKSDIDLLVKPFTRETLLRKVQEILHRSAEHENTP